MGDFSQGGVHKTDGFRWVIFQRGGEYTKPMGFDGWFFKGGSTQNQWDLMGFGIVFYCLWKLSARGVYFGKYGNDNELNHLIRYSSCNDLFSSVLSYPVYQSHPLRMPRSSTADEWFLVDDEVASPARKIDRFAAIQMSFPLPGTIRRTAQCHQREHQLFLWLLRRSNRLSPHQTWKEAARWPRN